MNVIRPEENVETLRLIQFDESLLVPCHVTVRRESDLCFILSALNRSFDLLVDFSAVPGFSEKIRPPSGGLSAVFRFLAYQSFSPSIARKALFPRETEPLPYQ